MKVYKEKPIVEVCLRKYEKPYQTGDELLRKFCISIGLLQPGDSRDTVVDVFKILLKNRETKILMDSNEIAELVKQKREIADSNVRRHLKKLEDLGIVERMPQGYRIREWLDIKTIMKDFVKKFIVEPTYERILEYADKIEQSLGFFKESN